jgi:hypothetical protein
MLTVALTETLFKTIYQKIQSQYERKFKILKYCSPNFTDTADEHIFLNNFANFVRKKSRLFLSRHFGAKYVELVYQQEA